MTCPTIRPLLELYVDGELDPERGLELEQHLADCTDCARERQQLLALRQALKADVPRYPAPARLRAAVQKAVRQAHRPRFAIPPAVWPWVTAASLLIGVGGAGLGWYGRGSGVEDTLAQQVVANHVRSLQASHLTDMLSSDRHTVKPWFADQHMSYAPPVKDFAAEGFTLVGGRLDVLNGRDTAALVYQCHLHHINLFVWPDDGRDTEPHARTLQGFHIVQWRHDDMAFAAVSDLETGELLRFARLLRE